MRLIDFRSCVLVMVMAVTSPRSDQSRAAPVATRGIPEPYLTIVAGNYREVLEGKALSSELLRQYFNKCMLGVLEHYHVYECWVCVQCLHDKEGLASKAGDIGFGFGSKPASCPVCKGTDSIYRVGTFQARAQRTGEAFENAFLFLMRQRWGLQLDKSPPLTQTHDFVHVGGRYAIEAKGSLEFLESDNQPRMKLSRAGISRSDTLKKAESNWQEFSRKNPGVEFYIVTNVLPKSKGYSKDLLGRVVDVTDPSALSRFAERLLAFDR